MTLTKAVKDRRGYGTRLLTMGLHVAARSEFQHWYDLVKNDQDPAQVLPALNALAAVAHRRGEMEAAREWLEQAVVLAERPGAPDLDRLRVYLNLMQHSTETGKLDEALLCSQRAAALQPDGGGVFSQVYWQNLSMLYWRRGDWVLMRQASRTAYDHYVRNGDKEGSFKAMTNLGIAHLELGMHRLAERDLLRALRIGEEIQSPQVAYAHAELGRLYFERGEHEAALAAGRKSLDALLSNVGVLDKEEVARVSRLFGAIFRLSGQRNSTLKYLNRAAAYFSQLGLRAEWQRSTEMIGQVLSVPPVPGRSHLTEEAQRLDFLTAVLDLTDDLESVDSYLRGHSERVSHLAVILGEELELGEEELRTLGYAGRLHDVGMVAVDIDLLAREGPLNEAELRRVAMHSVIGEEMLRPYGLKNEGLRAVRHHHEHYDGSGYPDQLAGVAIPLSARIIAVVDVYDSLTSDRVYRKAMAHDEAMTELLLMAGKELDPGLVGRFVELHRQ